jgi:hypothetical protein
VSIRPFPEDFERNIDFCPPFSIQEKIAPHQEMCFVIARTSLSKTKAEPPGKISNLQFIERRTTARSIDLVVGEEYPEGDPNDLDRSTSSEILEALENMGFNDATIAQRVIIHQNPKDLQHIEAFQEYDYLYEHQTASARRPHMIRKLLKTSIWNPYHFIRNELYKAGIVKSFKDVALKRMQSGLVTDWVRPAPPQLGWSHFGTYQGLLMRALSADLANRKRFWLDTGVPRSRRFQLNALNIDIRLFELVKNQQPIAFTLPESIVGS